MARDFKEFFYTLFRFTFSFQPFTHTIFTKTLNPKRKHHFQSSTTLLSRTKPIPVFDSRPLYCSSSATAVGTLGSNFVDSGTPTLQANQYISLIRDPCSFRIHESNQLLVEYKSISKIWVFFLLSTSHLFRRIEDCFPL